MENTESVEAANKLLYMRSYGIMLDSFIQNKLRFLVVKHGLHYAFQQMDYGGGFVSSEHSYFNDNGCFTICSLEQRGELDFYYAKSFTNNRKILHDKLVDVYSVEKSIWDKYGKIGIIPNVFFWCNHKKIIEVLAEVISHQICSTGTFFGVEINKVSNK